MTMTQPLDTEALQSGPIPVRVVSEARPNPYIGKFPSIDDEIETRRYRFTYNQNPGMPVEFTKGRTVIKKNGLLGTVFEKYKFMDGEEYDIPVDVAKHLNKVVYFEAGQKRTRCSCVEVD